MALSAQDKEFFGALADVVFGNPYSPRRFELIARLVPGAKVEELTNDREALARVVAAKLAPCHGSTEGALQRLAAEDRRLLETALLYVGYHRCVPQLDALIERQSIRLLELYGDLPAEKQDAVLEPSEERKLILSTNVAETSLTIPGVTLVIDSGLARINRYDEHTGLDRLELSPISKASADQRSGRAGRTLPDGRH